MIGDFFYSIWGPDLGDFMLGIFMVTVICLVCLVPFFIPVFRNAQAYARNSEHPEIWRSFKSLVGHAILWLVLFFAAFFFIGFFLKECDKPNQKIKDSYAYITKEMHSKVSNNIRYVQYNIYDVTADGKKNCQDSSILFYLFWQDRFPED